VPDKMNIVQAYANRMIRWSGYGFLIGLTLFLIGTFFSNGCQEGAMSYSECTTFGRDTSREVTFSTLIGGMFVAGSFIIFILNLLLLSISTSFQKRKDQNETTHNK